MLHTVRRSSDMNFTIYCNLQDSFEWFKSITFNKGFHPAIAECMQTEEPKDIRQVYLEWPRISTDGRLSYTQNEQKGEKGIETVTTIGRYIARHFDMPDHVVRAIVSKHTATGYSISADPQKIRDCVIKGPRSCMQWGTTDLGDSHPYDVYSPSLGWSVCYKEENGQIVSRALLNDKVFVRTYERCDGGYSQRDERMEQFLIGKGFTHAAGWLEGTKLKKMGMLPYLDGSNDRVDDEGDYFIIRRNGCIACDNTDGRIDSPEEDDYITSCERCGDGISEGDDYGYAGEDGDNTYCESCLNRYFTLAIGRRGNEYYVADCDVVTVNGQGYDPEYLSDNEIVQLSDGTYIHSDDAFYCEIDDEYYPCEVGQHTEDLGHVHKDNAWMCEHSGDWHSTRVEWVQTQDIGKCHPDNVWSCHVSGLWFSIDVRPLYDSEGNDVHPDYMTSDNLELELSVELV